MAEHVNETTVTGPEPPTAPAAPAAPCNESTAAGREMVTGQFTTGNQFARRTGVRAFEEHGEAALPQELRDDVAVFRSGVETDQGGESELTTIGAGYVRRLSEVEAIVRLLGADLQQRGLFTKRGRVRSTYNAFLLAVDRWDRLAQRLGLERKQRPIDPLDAVHAAVAEANKR